jgi:voltage-gated potassium channel
VTRDSMVGGRLEWLHRKLGFVNDIALLPMFTVMVLEATLDATSEQSHFLFESNLLFCLMFGAEWFLGLLIARKPFAYLVTPIKLADLVSSVPFGALFQSLRLLRALRAIRLLRVAWRTRRNRGRGEGLLRFAVLMCAVVASGAVGIRIAEPEVAPTFGDALWWSITTLSTVGYGDIVPASSAGRSLAAVMMLFGVGSFGYLAGAMTALVQGPEEDAQLALLQSIEARLKSLEHLASRQSGE